MTFEIKKLGRRLGLSLGAGVILAGVAPLAMVGATSPTAIGSCRDLQKIGTGVSMPLNGSYVLGNDIDCTAATSSGGALYNSGKGFSPIGSDTNPFTGTLNGQGFTITGLKMNHNADEDVGLFSNTVGATVENLHFVGASVAGEENVGVVSGEEESITLDSVTGVGRVSTPVGGGGYAGGLVGWNKTNSSGPSHFSNDFFGGTVTGSDYSLGGLMGDNDGDAVITESGSSADVKCNDSANSCNYVGGLDGDSDGLLTISKSFATGAVDAGATSGDSAGGLVGWSDDDTISNSFATGSVISDVRSGGLLGEANSGTVDKSYSSGEVSGSGSDIGGFVGEDGGLTYTDSFFDTDTTTQNACGSGACTGITGLDTNGMKDQHNFSSAGWDFNNTWGQESGMFLGFPYLQWSAQSESTNPVTGKKAELIVPNYCNVQSMDMQAESANATHDSSYMYPDGMMNFTVNCGTPYIAAEIVQYIYGVPKGTYTVRKYNSFTHKYATVPGANVSFVGINGETVARIQYTVADGSSLDGDGTANGIIVDPVGLAVATPSAPNTGAGAADGKVLPVGLLAAGSAGAIVTRRYSRR